MTSSRIGARRTALWGIIAAVFISGTGVGSILPILPLFLRERGASFSLVGVVVSASLVAQAIGQYPAGWLSDRLGRRELTVGGLLAAAVASAAFILPVSVLWLIALRFVQGLGFAAAAPAERAVVADLVPAAEMGVAYGWLSGARMAGLIVGPALGGVLAGFGRAAVFAATAAALVVAAGVVAAALRSADRGAGGATTAPPASRQESTRGAMAMRGVLSLTLGVGFLVGIYDVVWSLYMRFIGATDWQVGLSFSLFALPLVLTAPLAGWASDRWDRRWLAVGSSAAVAVMAPIYPFLRSIPLILALSVVEGAAWAFADPAMNAFLMDAVQAEARGQAQGTVGTAQGGAMAVGAVAGGALFSIAVVAPFAAAAAVCAVLVVVSVPLLRRAGGT